MNLSENSGNSGIDFVPIFLYCILCAIGVAAIFTSIYTQEITFIDFNKLHFKQIIWFGVSITLGFLIIITDGSFFTKTAYLSYLFFILLLVLVIFFGRDVKGGTSWFDLGFFRFQPSEFMKFATCLAVAKYCSSIGVYIKNWLSFAIAAAICILPMMLIIVQGDTGTALVFSAFFIALYRVGMPTILVIIGAALVIFAVLALYFSINIILIVLAVLSILGTFQLLRNGNIRDIVALLTFIILTGFYSFAVNYAFTNVLKPHQQNRINVLLNKVDDVKNVGYNVYQSKIAMGSGGFFGRGYTKGIQTKFNFVPELSTDFIFCTIGEEFGFIGVTLVLIIYFYLLFYIIKIAERQRSTFSLVYGYGVASVIFFHVFINVGMTIGLVPVIGIPLPFISYGGSSMLGFTILLFILIKLDSNRFLLLR